MQHNRVCKKANSVDTKQNGTDCVWYVRINLLNFLLSVSKTQFAIALVFMYSMVNKVMWLAHSKLSVHHFSYRKTQLSLNRFRVVCFVWSAHFLEIFELFSMVLKAFVGLFVLLFVTLHFLFDWVFFLDRASIWCQFTTTIVHYNFKSNVGF